MANESVLTRLRPKRSLFGLTAERWRAWYVVLNNAHQMLDYAILFNTGLDQLDCGQELQL